MNPKHWPLCLLLFLLLQGCTPHSHGGHEHGGQQHSGNTAEPTPHAHEHGHDHSHDHSHDHDHPHDHAHTAPHGGGLTALGAEAAHLELTLDQATGEVNVYLLDGSAERALRTESRQQLVLEVTEPVKEKLELLPVADSLSGETEASTSRFRATSSALKGQATLKGSIALVTLKGQTYPKVPVDFPTGIPEK